MARMRSRRTVRVGRLGFALVGSVALACGAPSEQDMPNVGGDTHWLAACETHDECDGGDCIWGVCSAFCSDAAQCGEERGAECFDVASPGLARLPDYRVADAGDAPGICLAACEADGDCSLGQVCHVGACLTDRAATGAGTPASGATVREAEGPLSAADFAGLQPRVSFDEPAKSPMPRRAFTSAAAERLVGTWVEPTCGSGPSSTCMRLEFTRDADSGRVQGEAHWDRSGPEVLAPDVSGAVVDPEEGYPTPDFMAFLGVLVQFWPGHHAPVFDPEFEGDLLTYWSSPIHLWAEWCRLQTSYPVPDGEPRYQCVDPTAQRDEIDSVRLGSCTSRLSDGICESEEGKAVPCNCLDEWGREQLSLATCTPPVCRCDMGGCEANYHASVHRFGFRVEGDTMTSVRGPLQRGLVGDTVRLVREARR